MISLVQSLGAWSWIILGGLLLAVELMAPGTFMLWLGLSAILVGLITFAIDWSWREQGVAFAILAVLSLIVWWKIGRRAKDENDQPFLNRRAEAFVGRVFTLEKPIVGGVGTVRIDDTVWRVSGPDSPSGSRIKVARAEGAMLFVEQTTDA